MHPKIHLTNKLYPEKLTKMHCYSHIKTIHTFTYMYYRGFYNFTSTCISSAWPACLLQDLPTLHLLLKISSPQRLFSCYHRSVAKIKVGHCAIVFAFILL